MREVHGTHPHGRHVPTQGRRASLRSTHGRLLVQDLCHQGRGYQVTRHSFKFADWTAAPDPNAAARYTVICRDTVNGAADDSRECAQPCGWSFIVLDDKAETERQQRAHVEATGHRLFVEHSTCYTVITVPPGSVVAGRIARRERAVTR